MKFHRNLAIAGIAAVCVAGSASAAPILDVNFGSENDGLGGFVTNSQAGVWTTELNSIRYTEAAEGMTNATLIRQFTGDDVLSTAAGSAYSFSTVIDSSSAGANSNNRFAMTLFANTGTAADLINVGISINLDGNGLFYINRGLNQFADNVTYAWNTNGGAPIGTSVFTVEATVSFSATQATISATLTDSADPAFSHTISNHSFDLTDLTLGQYFGVSSRARTDQGENIPFTMDVQSFQIIPEPSTAALLHGGMAMMMGLRRRRSA